MLRSWISGGFLVKRLKYIEIPTSDAASTSLLLLGSLLGLATCHSTPSSPHPIFVFIRTLAKEKLSALLAGVKLFVPWPAFTRQMRRKPEELL